MPETICKIIRCGYGAAANAEALVTSRKELVKAGLGDAAAEMLDRHAHESNDLLLKIENASDEKT